MGCVGIEKIILHLRVAEFWLKTSVITKVITDVHGQIHFFLLDPCFLPNV